MSRRPAPVCSMSRRPIGRRKSKICIIFMQLRVTIKSKEKNYIYVGLTNNPERRIAEHNYKKEKTTRFYAPLKTY